MKKAVLCGATIAALLVVAVQIAPDVKRYLRIRNM
ncbi:DUF6893 family small protein [Streptomyces sp. NPDC054838]